ncbi:MAG: hypothetical protein LUM44_14075 [Pyrinomonadaceae bacterium]|nr:hypothetical protein [Pyrinomonadaceae bacterium]
MSENTNLTKMQIVLPALSVVLLVSIYIVCQLLFMDCADGNCQSVNGKLLSEVSNPVNLSEAEKNINGKKAEITKLKEKYGKSQEEQQKKIEEETTNYLLMGNEQKMLADEQFKNPDLDANKHMTNINGYTAKIAAVNKEVNLAQTNTDTALNDLNAKTTELKQLREQISKRYSSRVNWLFLSAFVFGFTVIGIVISIRIIGRLGEPLSSKWLVLTGSIAVICFIVISLLGEKLMSISSSLLESSLFTNGDLSPFWLAVTNAVVFPVIVFFTSASCAVIYLVKKSTVTQTGLDELKERKRVIDETIDEIENLPVVSPPDPDNEKKKSALDTKLTELLAKYSEMTKTAEQFYKDLRGEAKLILYVGSALLFAGLVRMQLIASWHVLFISKDFSDVLSPFQTTVTAVQGGFYSILLAALYFPMVYSIPPKPDSPDGIDETLNEKGVLQVLKEYAPRLIALSSPFLAGPVADLVKYLTGTAGS